MASVVEICNMALSHIGSEARVASIDPPDGSVEAGYCSTFYDSARVEMLELGNWSFSLTRATLAELVNDADEWLYAYALPSDCLSPRRVLRVVPGVAVLEQDFGLIDFAATGGAPFEIEGNVLRTNQPSAVLLYVRDMTDVNRFTPSFRTALSFALAAYLAGPVVRGAEGAKLANAMRERARAMALASASVAANASSETDPMVAGSMRARR